MIVPGTGDPPIHSFSGDNQQSHRCTERQQRKKEEPGEPDRTLRCIPEPPDSPRRQCAEIPGHCNNQSSTDRYINIHNPSGSINRSSDVLSGNVARFVAGFYRVVSGAQERGTSRIQIRFYREIRREKWGLRQRVPQIPAELRDMFLW